jgi:RimJ/RimL family protein N-acetyltransferase
VTSESPPPRSEIPKLSELPLVIETPRLKLRPFTESDLEDLWPYVSDPEFPQFMTWAAHRDREQTRAFFASRAEVLAAGTGVAWVIEHAGRASGTIGLDAITWHFGALRFDRAELGYWLATPLHNQGVCTEAAQAVVQWGFETLGLHKVRVGCFEANVASRRVIEKLGFRFVGREEDHAWRNGRWHHHLRYEVTVAEWSDSARTLRFRRDR